MNTTGKVILWDVMGTLTHDPFFVEVPAFFDMTLAELIACKHPDNWVRFELGQIDEDAMLRGFFADGRAFDGDGLKRTMQAAYRLLPGIEALLDRLAARGHSMHALSNYTQWYQLIESQLSLSRWLRWSFVSCEVGARKPQPEIYRHALKTLGVEPTGCVFIDDREENCEGARAVGIEAIRFENAAQLAAALHSLGM